MQDAFLEFRQWRWAGRSAAGRGLERQQGQDVQHGEHFFGRGVVVVVVLVDRLETAVHDVVHPWAPVVPEVAQGFDHDGHAAVAVAVQFRVEQVDGGNPVAVPDVDQTDLVRDLDWDEVQDVARQVAVGVDHHDGVSVVALRLVAQLAGDDVGGERALPHAGFAEQEHVPAQDGVGYADRRVGADRVADQGSLVNALQVGAELP